MAQNRITSEDLHSFYYTAKLDNLRSIIQLGILSHNNAIEKKVYKPQNDISNKEVQRIRENKTFFSPRSHKKRKLHDCVNLHLQPGNAFMVVIQKETPRSQLCTLRIKRQILKDRQHEAVLTTKNAACYQAKFFAPKDWVPSPNTTKALTAPNFSGLDTTEWAGGDKFLAAKQSRQSEALFPARIDPKYIDSILVYDETVRIAVLEMLADLPVTIPVSTHPSLYPTPKSGVFNKEVKLSPDPLNLSRLFTNNDDESDRKTKKRALCDENEFDSNKKNSC